VDEYPEEIDAIVTLYGSMMGWRGSSKGFGAHPAMGVLANVELANMTDGLSQYDRALLLWGVRMFHQTAIAIAEAKVTNGA